MYDAFIYYLYAVILPLRDAGKACGNISVTCLICRQLLSHCPDYVIIFACGHAYHSMCLSESKSCYKCLNTKGWAPIATNTMHTAELSLVGCVCNVPYIILYNYFECFIFLCYFAIFILQRKKLLLPPEFLRHKDLTLRLAPPCPVPDFEGIF